MTSLLAQHLPTATPSGPDPGWYDRARELGRQLKFDGSVLFPPQYFFLGAAVLLLVIAALWLGKRHQQRHLRPRPLATFNQIAAAMGLSLNDRWLLIRIARHQDLPSPLTLILSSPTLHHYAQCYTQAIHPVRRHAVANHVTAIGQRLFDADTKPQPPTKTNHARRSSHRHARNKNKRSR
ncbi:MAG: hypothetical protein V3U29_02770 [Phycisphaeraceae bacterium]